MLYGSSSSCALVSLALPPLAQLADAPLKLAEHTAAHRDVAEALAVSLNGKHVVSGGNDRIVKVWDGKQLAKPSTARGRKASADVQAFVGHSDHVTRVAFSADGTSLRRWAAAFRRNSALAEAAICRRASSSEVTWCEVTL